MSYAPAPPPYAAIPPKTRSSTAWWITGGLLILAALGSFPTFAVLLFSTVGDAVENPSNVTFVADGRAHPVSLGDAAKGYIWLNGTTQGVRCKVTDRANGRQLPQRGPSAVMEYDQWRGVSSFPAGSGRVAVSCRGGTHLDRALVGAAPRMGRVVTFAVLMFVTPLLLGLAGAVLLVVALVRTVSRPPMPAGYAPVGYLPVPGSYPPPGSFPSGPADPPDQGFPPTHTDR